MSADANSPNGSKSPSWWTTLPGVLTALAGIITAMAGLVVALHQAGVMGRSSGQASESQAAQGEQTSGQPKQVRSSAGGKTGEGLVSFPSGDQIVLGAGQGRMLFKILATRLEPRSNNRLELRVGIRVTNYTHDPVYCGNSLRLLVDQAPQAPSLTTHFDTPVDGGSAREGDAMFEIPDSTRHVTFQVVDPRNSSGNTYELPLDFSAPKP